MRRGADGAEVTNEVHLTAVASSAEAEVVCGILRAKGIASSYRDTDSAVVAWPFGWQEVLVYERDLAEARGPQVEWRRPEEERSAASPLTPLVSWLWLVGAVFLFAAVLAEAGSRTTTRRRRRQRVCVTVLSSIDQAR